MADKSVHEFFLQRSLFARQNISQMLRKTIDSVPIPPTYAAVSNVQPYRRVKAKPVFYIAGEQSAFCIDIGLTGRIWVEPWKKHRLFYENIK